jgi:hypothetical protein
VERRTVHGAAVIHLWGKFWIAAWRGRHAATRITGVVAFLASVVECFTGYLSQQNFDSQWIATNGKDAFTAAGVGVFFNLMNFGQMLLWHVVLLAIATVVILGLTATHGPPYNTNGTPQSERFAPASWAGVRQPIDTAQSLVISPLTQTASINTAVKAALAAPTWPPPITSPVTSGA